MNHSALTALRQRLSACLITACVTLCGFFATVNPPPAQAGGIEDTLSLLSQFAPLVDSYIAPASLTWLPPLYEALGSPECSNLGSDVAVVQCADALLAQPAAATLAGANVQSLRTVLELYLDVRSSDWGELFNDIFKLVTGGDPLSVVCKVLAIVTSGFPVCGVLELLYDIGKFAYEAAGQVLEGLKEFGCAVISLFYDCDDDSTKVGPVQYVADVYFKPRLNEGIQARTTSAAAWASHRQQLLDERAKQPTNTVTGTTFNNPTLNQQGFDFYATNYVYPAWVKVLDQVRGAGYKAATQFVQSDPQLYLKLLNAPDDAARMALAVQRRDNCYAVMKPFSDQLLAAAAEGQGTASPSSLNALCTSQLREAAMPISVFKRGVGNSGSSNDWLSNNYATMSVCETLRIAFAQSNPINNAISGCGVTNTTQAGQLAMATLMPTPAGCKPYNVQVNAERIQCDTMEQSQACNAQLKARYGGVGLPSKAIAHCFYDLPVAGTPIDTTGFVLNGNAVNQAGAGAAAGLDPRLGVSPAAEPPRCKPTPRQGVLQCPTLPSLQVCMQLKRDGRVRDCLPPR
ncbi:MAG: hypothetical protein V4650_04490 [Pseudomonadota bacterium]